MTTTDAAAEAKHREQARLHREANDHRLAMDMIDRMDYVARTLRGVVRRGALKPKALEMVQDAAHQLVKATEGTP